MAAESGTQARSQTLSRGIRLLEILASADGNLTIAELTAALDVHRSVAYRLLRTLEDHNLVTRDATGRFAPGAGLAALSAGVARDLQVIALPMLNDAANELGMTCILAVMLDTGEAVTLSTAMPRQSVAAVSYRPGHRHPISSGAPGKAILMSMPESSWPPNLSLETRADIEAARERGYAMSSGEVVPSLTSLAVPLILPGQPPASVAAIHLGFSRPEAEIAAVLAAAAQEVRRSYGLT
ncbi:MAG TPA: helix-turn-helix domain-containing protein [Pseudolysinimonas sp.]|nr:helix-turn-helix domain-containing protein [Pseudolysinimonas sp.]